MGSQVAAEPRRRSAGAGETFEVVTASSDVLRANLRLHGTLSARTCPLLRSVLATHIRAGRRYLRVDVGSADVDDPRVLGPLREAHEAMDAVDGMLVFDNADDALAGLLHDGGLFVSTAFS
jgi:anti-anti-sigma regulatory factor